jgi:GNAT superfamily N-acetyltransferase
MIGEWIAKAEETANGFGLVFWEGAYPQEHLEGFAQLFDVMNSAPRGNLEVEDFHFTPELLRQIEQMTFATGTQRWTLIAQEKATGKLAGYSEITWNPKRPKVLNQQGTGVYPEFRKLGLGRWLKAAMLERVLRELPEARFVRTGNADSNVPMLKINHELGFKPYMAEATWQIETAKLSTHLSD